MSKGLSVYLDLLRLLAASCVVIGHARHFVAPGMPEAVTIFTGEGVAVFFVLSGFMMRFVVSTKERDWRTYLDRRFIRLVSVVPLALVVTALVDAAGRSLAPGAYAGYGFAGGHGPRELLAALAFVNELWRQHVVFGTNEPFWSLGFEVPYYVAFGILTFARGRLRIASCIAWLLIVGPKIALYLPLWFTGVVAYEAIRRLPALVPDAASRRRLGLALAIGGAAGFLGWKALLGGAWGIYHFDDVRDVLRSVTYYHVVGGMVMLNIIGVGLLAPEMSWNPRVARVIAWLAGASFTLYLMHQPILLALAAATPSLATSAAIQALLMLVAVAVILALAELGERRKHWYARLFGRLAMLSRRRQPL